MFGLYGDLPQVKAPTSKEASDGIAPTWFSAKLKPALKRTTVLETSQNDAKVILRPQSKSALLQGAATPLKFVTI